MNIIEESFKQNNKKSTKKAPKIILVIIILLVFIIIGIIITLAYIDNTTLKVYVNDKLNTKVKDMLVFEEDTTYVPIADIAPHLGYQCFNGDYAEKSEAKNKCYIQSEYEIANFVLNSEKIYKLETQQSNSAYQYFYAKKKVKAKNGKLYVSTDGMEEAFNVSYIHDKDKNRIYIYTMDYLISSYNPMILDKGYTEMSEKFNDQKSVFDSRLIVEADTKQVGVVDLQGNVIMEPKYEEITYIPQTGDFFVKNNGKVGIISKSGDMKIQILYDSLKLIDRDAGLYVAEREGQYGIIDIKGNIKLYIENDQIGLDISKFEKNDIRNDSLLLDTLIPVKKDDLWGLYNKNGKQVVDFKYDDFGYVASSNKDALNLLVVPNYDVIVTCKDDKYGLINASGKEIFPTRADDIYLTIESGNKYYYLNYLDQRYDVEKWLNDIGVKATKTEETGNNSSTEKSDNKETSSNGNTSNEQEQKNEENQEQKSEEENRQEENQDEQSNQEEQSNEEQEENQDE